MSRDLLTRAAWTAGQTFLAALGANAASITDLATAKAALLAAAAAALSAAKTAVVTYYTGRSR